LNLISLHEFRALFRDAKSASVVGNSDSLLSQSNGPRIDQSDLVVRFNVARVEGLEAHVGTRTDILVANQVNTLKRSPAPGTILRPRAALVIVQLMEPRQLDSSELAEWLGDIPVCMTLAPDLISVSTSERRRAFNTGLYALHILTRMLELEEMYLTGFTLFGLVAGGHHKFDHSPGEKWKGSWHDGDDEQRVMVRILEQFPGRIDASPETRELLTAGGFTRWLEPGEPRRYKKMEVLAQIIAFYLMRFAFRLRALGLRWSNRR